MRGGGPSDGDLFRRPLCGVSITNSDWIVTFEWYGHGFASIDLRDALEQVPVPTAADIGDQVAPPKQLPAHVFEFAIDGQDFAYVLTDVSVTPNGILRARQDGGRRPIQLHTGRPVVPVSQ